MGSTTLITVEEYLNTDYSPDCDFVDGVLEDRNVGQKTHALIQKRILLFLANLEQQLGIFALQEQRLRIGAARFRVPDICVMLGGEPTEEVFTVAPFLCVEVLSPDDRMSRMQEKIRDYLNMGVSHVWLVDPYLRTAWTYTSAGAVEAKDGVLRTSNPAVAMPLATIFQ